MRASFRMTLVVGVALAGFAGTRPIAQGNPEAAKVQNPVAPSAASIAEGKRTYLRFCANCHGSNGEGGPGNDLAPPAPGLTGKEWKHGSTDGEIFNTIKTGVPPDFNMAAWGDQGLMDTDIWNIVNYVRSLPKN